MSDSLPVNTHRLAFNFIKGVQVLPAFMPFKRLVVIAEKPPTSFPSVGPNQSPSNTALTLRSKHEGVSLAVLECCECAPGLLFGRCIKRHASGREFFERLFHVFAMVGDACKRADAVLLPFRCEESNAGFSLRDTKLEPALLFLEGLIGDDREAQFFGIKLQRALLV